MVFMLTIYIPVLGNNLLALKEGTFCTDDDKLDERSVRTNAKVELLARPLVLLWWYFVILSKHWMPSTPAQPKMEAPFGVQK